MNSAAAHANGPSESLVNDLLRRALDYPYPREPNSFVFQDGAAYPWPKDLDLSGRNPVLAVGSNASVQQLQRKFGGKGGCCIPVSRAVLPHHDVVFAAYMTSYGSLPATVTRSPGTRVDVYINWLDSAQLDTMHATESVGSHTDFGTLRVTLESLSDTSVNARLHADGSLDAGLYVSRLSVFAPRGAAIALAEVRAVNRQLRAFTQHAVQRAACHVCAPGTELATWIQANIADPAHRAETTRWLQARAVTVDLPLFERDA